MPIYSDSVHMKLILLNIIEKSVVEHYTITPAIIEYESFRVISLYSIRLKARVFNCRSDNNP
jgi:hypothetical protein